MAGYRYTVYFPERRMGRVLIARNTYCIFFIWKQRDIFLSKLGNSVKQQKTRNCTETETGESAVREQDQVAKLAGSIW